MIDLFNKIDLCISHKNLHLNIFFKFPMTRVMNKNRNKKDLNKKIKAMLSKFSWNNRSPISSLGSQYADDPQYIWWFRVSIESFIGTQVIFVHVRKLISFLKQVACSLGKNPNLIQMGSKAIMQRLSHVFKRQFFHPYLVSFLGKSLSWCVDYIICFRNSLGTRKRFLVLTVY